MASITEFIDRRGGVCLLAVTLMVLAGTVVLTPALAQDQEKEEIIIEGEDKAPAESAFEYKETEGGTEAEERLDKTGDVPGVSEPVEKDDPTLKKDVGTRHQKLESEKKTSVKGWKGWQIFLIVLGVGAVAATL